MRFCLYVLTVLFCVLLHSCIEGDEEVWIEGDGSGRMEAVYRVPTMLLSEDEAMEFEAAVERGVGSSKHLNLLVNEVEKERGQWVIKIGVETDDVRALEALSSGSGTGGQLSKADMILNAIVGVIDVEIEGLSASLRREVDLTPVLEKYVGEKAALVLRDAEFRYVVHLPEPVEQSNAHEVINQGRTLRWRYNLGALKGAPIVMDMKSPVPMPWWVYGAGVFLMVVVVWGIYVLMRKRLKTSSTRA